MARRKDQDNSEAMAEDQVADPQPASIDHLACIREIAMMLPDASPSGATAASQKILEHLDAHANPDAYNERMAAEQKQAEEDEKIRAERRAAVKKPVEETPAA